MLLQQTNTGHDALESASTVAILAVTVVDGLRAIEADPDKEFVLLEEPAPFVVQMQPVGLQHVTDLTLRTERLLQLNDAAEEVNAQQRRFTAVPDELHHRGGLRGDVFLYVFRKYRLGHLELLATREKRSLLKVKAVIARDVAHCADRFGEYVDSGLTANSGRIRQICPLNLEGRRSPCRESPAALRVLLHFNRQLWNAAGET
ncbi:hypothetical protein GGR36_002494 [Niveibacterium umoris]|uniref:Uncharacterized protein n=1 Tax=Niveibacterium umoris TaxID=1193620 RepID=A0A840BNN0_9RHOO|nr:hypothetical protein [Niveibacterium umoris]